MSEARAAAIATMVTACNQAVAFMADQRRALRCIPAIDLTALEQQTAKAASAFADAAERVAATASALERTVEQVAATADALERTVKQVVPRLPQMARAAMRHLRRKAGRWGRAVAELYAGLPPAIVKLLLAIAMRAAIRRIILALPVSENEDRFAGYRDYRPLFYETPLKRLPQIKPNAPAY